MKVYVVIETSDFGDGCSSIAVVYKNIDDAIRYIQDMSNYDERLGGRKIEFVNGVLVKGIRERSINNGEPYSVDYRLWGPTTVY